MWHCKGEGGPEDLGLAFKVGTAAVGTDVNKDMGVTEGRGVSVGNSEVARRVGGGTGVIVGCRELIGAAVNVGAATVATGLCGLTPGMIDWPMPALQAPNSESTTSPEKQICRDFMVSSLPYKTLIGKTGKHFLIRAELYYSLHSAVQHTVNC